jgi:hypothetical protein
VRLTWEGGTSEVALEVVPDPGDPDVTLAAYREQFRVSMAAADTLGRVRDAIQRLESIDAQVDSLATWAEGAEAEGLAERVRTFAATLERLQQQLTSHETDGGPPGLRTLAGIDRQYSSLLGNLNGGGGYGGGSTEGAPTAGALERQRDLDAEWGVLSRGLARLLEAELAELNVEVERLGGPVIEVR